MVLREIKIIDMKRSVVDKDKSDPEKGVYVFKKKEYVDYADASVRPSWFVQWNRHTPDGWEIQDWMTNWHYSFVTKDDPFLPENVALDTEGHYRFKDAVLMKCPMKDYVEKRRQDMDRAVRRRDAKKKEFHMEAQKAKAALDEEYLKRIFGE